MIVKRAYKLKLYGNQQKTSTAKYFLNRFILYTQYCVGRNYFNGNKAFSTKNSCALLNQAQRKSMGIIRALKESEKSTHSTANVPQIKNISAPVRLKIAKKGKFDYWVRVPNQWSKGGGVLLPAKSHKAFNKALKNNWKISSCEIKEIQGALYAVVYVKKEVDRARPRKDCIGIDIGYKYSIATSGGYLGKRTDRIIKKGIKKNSERLRQKSFGQQQRKKYKKSRIKQLLDKEARYLIRRSKKTLSSLAIESPKVIANLKWGNLHGWARCYLFARLSILASENSIFLVDVHPAFSSVTCSKCGAVDKKSRYRQNFKCVSCGHLDHADINAAKILRQRGQRVLQKIRTL